MGTAPRRIGISEHACSSPCKNILGGNHSLRPLWNTILVGRVGYSPPPFSASCHAFCEMHQTLINTGDSPLSLLSMPSILSPVWAQFPTKTDTNDTKLVWFQLHTPRCQKAQARDSLNSAISASRVRQLSRSRAGSASGFSPAHQHWSSR